MKIAFGFYDVVLLILLNHSISGRIEKNRECESVKAGDEVREREKKTQNEREWESLRGRERGSIT